MSDKSVNKVQASTPRARSVGGKKKATGLRRTVGAPKEHSVESSKTSTAGRAQQSLFGFQVESFFADVGHSVGKLLGDFNVVNLTSERTGIDSLFEPGLSMESTLLTLVDHADKGTGLKGSMFKGKSVVELKRLADNIQKAKAGGAQFVLNECIDKSDAVSGRKAVFKRAEKILDTLEKKVDQLLKEKIEGYEAPKLEDKSVVLNQELVDRLLHESEYKYKGGFSPKFSESLFDEYSKEPITASESKPYVTEKGENMIISEQAYKDLNRNDYVLVDKFGKVIKSDRTTYPSFTDEDKKALREQGKKEGLDDKQIEAKIKEKDDETKAAQFKWKKDLINEFIKMCGYDENKDYGSSEKKEEAKKEAEKKLFKLSQCMSQTMGNGYTLASMKSEDAPQLLEGESFTIGSYHAKTESHMELTEGSDGSLVLKNIVESRDIKAITVAGGNITQTDPESTYYKREVGVILDPQNEWKEYKAGKLEYKIVKEQE